MDNTIYSFNEWSSVFDYESDNEIVTLLDFNGNEIASYGYTKFTKADFDSFKNPTT